VRVMIVAPTVRVDLFVLSFRMNHVVVMIVVMIVSSQMVDAMFLMIVTQVSVPVPEGWFRRIRVRVKVRNATMFTGIVVWKKVSSFVGFCHPGFLFTHVRVG